MANLLHIDGSVLEGGGQILRMSVALSAIMGIPVKVTQIRAGRSKPGLAAQHLKGIQLVAEMCRASVKGATIGSTEIEFAPGNISGGVYVADTHTAGSISLLVQSALPVALLADGPVTLQLRGGTNVPHAPQLDYLTEVFRPLLEKFGGTFDFELHTRGYFPRGGGHVTVRVRPVHHLRAVTLTHFGQVSKVYGWSFVAGSLPIKMAYDMADGAKEELKQLSDHVHIECYKESGHVARDNCSGVLVVCESSGGCVAGADALGRRGTAARDVGREAGRTLARLPPCCLDTHAQDQVVVLMTLAAGRSALRVGSLTLHTNTAMHVASLLTAVKFSVTSSEGSTVLECEGLGRTNQGWGSSGLGRTFPTDDLQ